MSFSIERRKFLTASAAALATATAARAAKDDPIRIGHIGVGKRGTTHLRKVVTQGDFKVAAVCDIDANARDGALSVAQASNPRSYTDYRELLAQKDIDAVLIATPCYLHAEMAAAALDAGKHVYCEKPLGITADQVRLAVDAAKKSKAVLQIGQQSRNSVVLQDAVRQIHEKGVIGQPFVVKAQRHSTPSKEEDKSQSGSGMSRRFPGWYDDVKFSGDLIVENAIHNIDVCNWLAGSRPVSAYGHGKRYLPETMPAGFKMMDGFSVEYIYLNDMHLDYSQLYLHPRSLKSLKNNQWFVVFGEKGALEVTYDSWTFHEMYGDQEPVSYAGPEDDDLTVAAHQDFIASIREHRKPLCDLEIGATAALTSIMGREAIYQRRMVTWDEMGVTL